MTSHFIFEDGIVVSVSRARGIENWVTYSLRNLSCSCGSPQTPRGRPELHHPIIPRTLNPTCHICSWKRRTSCGVHGLLLAAAASLRWHASVVRA